VSDTQVNGCFLSQPLLLKIIREVLTSSLSVSAAHCITNQPVMGTGH